MLWISQSPTIRLLQNCTRYLRLYPVIVLGQGKSNGLALLGRTKNIYFLSRITWQFFEKARKASKHSDASAGIEVEWS